MKAPRLLDDDGLVLVVVPERFEAALAHRDFDYDFPNEVVAAVRERWAIPIPTNGGGEIVVEVRLGGPGHGRWQVDLAQAGSLAVVTYSQFTFAADGDAKLEPLDGLVAFTDVLPAGTYAVEVHRTSRDDADSFVSITLRPSTRVTNVISDDWNLEDPIECAPP
ncbi:MAG: hypothetical protein H6722_12425 [Sandaracinus sp.]|nr:hypothetical protein [Sandaracinus sp.]MCB9613251.1 hypothetical protein [Sandaracinus sp.]